MAVIFWIGALLIGLVVGLAAAVMLVVEYIGYGIGVGATVLARGVAEHLPGRRTA